MVRLVVNRLNVCACALPPPTSIRLPAASSAVSSSSLRSSRLQLASTTLANLRRCSLFSARRAFRGTKGKEQQKGKEKHSGQSKRSRAVQCSRADTNSNTATTAERSPSPPTGRWSSLAFGCSRPLVAAAAAPAAAAAAAMLDESMFEDIHEVRRRTDSEGRRTARADGRGASDRWVRRRAIAATAGAVCSLSARRSVAVLPSPSDRRELRLPQGRRGEGCRHTYTNEIALC